MTVEGGTSFLPMAIGVLGTGQRQLPGADRFLPLVNSRALPMDAMQRGS